MSLKHEQPHPEWLKNIPGNHPIETEFRPGNVAPLVRTIEELRRDLSAATARAEKAEALVSTECRDWAHDHTHIQNLCRKHGYNEATVEGDSYGVPGIIDLANLLSQKIETAQAERDALRKDKERLDWLETNACSVEYNDPDECPAHFEVLGWGRCMGERREHLRDAIDAARTAQAQQTKPRTCGECKHFLSAAEIDGDVCMSEDGESPTYTHAANEGAAKCNSFTPRADAQKGQPS